MKKLLITIGIFTTMIFVVVKADVAVKTIKPAALPEHTVESLNDASVKGELGNIDNWNDLSPTWSKLRDADILIKFKKPAELPDIAIGKLGWDWAVPELIAVTVNDGKELQYELKSPRLSPLSKKIEACVIPLSGQLVKSLRIRVIKVQTPYNSFGTLKIVKPEFMPAEIMLPNVLPVDAAGIKISVRKRQDFNNAAIRAFAKRFGKDICWEYPLTNSPEAESEISLRWEQFHSSEYPGVIISPENVYKLEVPKELNLLGWKFVTDPRQRNLPAWQQLQKLTFAPNVNGWRSGIPKNGFGRFGYDQTNGLLIGTLSPNNLTYRIESGSSNDVLQLGIECGPPGQDNAWQRFEVNWTGVVVSQLKKISRVNSDNALSKAYGVYDKNRLPEKFIYSSLAPGFLVKSSDKILRLVTSEKDGMPWIFYMEHGNKLTWSPLNKEFNAAKLSQGWCVVAWKNKSRLPVLLSFQRHPATFGFKGGILEIGFSDAMGYLGIGMPAGYRGWNGTIGTESGQNTKLAEKARFLASVLRAYPVSCDMRFLDAPDRIRFKESFGYICWQNEWDEPWTKIAPLPPLVTFAKNTGYPVEFSGDKTVNTGIDTKYGPYYVNTGSTAEYSLPLPDYDDTFYLRPSVENELMKLVTGKLTSYLVNKKITPATNALGCWWMFAPSSLALPLWAGEQREKIIASWKAYVKLALSPRVWYLRTEPFSGMKYMVSFAWIDRKMEILGDPNSGNGGTLYGLWAYARTSGDWDMIENNWDVVQGALRYFLVCHDWTMLQSGCREHTASSSVDMDGAAYQGTAAFLQMATVLGKKDDAAVGRMLLSRLALSTVVRWRGMSWVEPEKKQEQLDSISLGLCENRGFDCMSVRNRSPHNAHGHISLSLAWIGESPMLYNLHLWGGGQNFWKMLEYEWLENKLPDWRKAYPGTLCYHYSIVMPHLYMRALLGEPQSSLRQELEKQVNKKGVKWFFAPDERQAAEQAPFYALYWGMDFPVRIRNWSGAVLQFAEYIEKTKTAVIILNSKKSDSIKFDLKLMPKHATINGKTPLALNLGANTVEIPSGVSELTIKF